MSSDFLLLGPIVFQDFELPDRVRWGGRQRMAVHHLPGGARVIDTLGRDDGEITWSGIFAGEEAVIRARLVDALRAQGRVWPLIWDAFFYEVVIADFSADFARSNWIPYRLSCTVLRDEIGDLLSTALSLADSLASDLTAAVALGSPVDLSGATAAVAVAGATRPGTIASAQALATVQTASSSIDAALPAAEAQATAAADPASAADAAADLAALTASRGYVRRARRNLEDATT